MGDRLRLGVLPDRGVLRELPTFLLHMLVCSLGGFSRLDVFKRVSEMDYGHLTRVLRRVVALTDLGYTQAEACELASQSTSSQHLKGFLLKFSQSVKAGEEPSDFLDREYATSMMDYGSTHSEHMEMLKRVSEAYAAIMSSSVFLIVVMVLMAMMMDLSENMFWAALVLVITTCGMLGLIFWMFSMTTGILPRKRGPKASLFLRASRVSLLISALMIAFALLLARSGSSAAPPLLMSISGIPPLVTGFLGTRHLGRVKSWDEGYPEFASTLCSSLEASGLSAMGVIADVSRVDFGPLNQPVERLRARLRLGVSEGKCWDLFMRELDSKLIQTHTRVFLDATSSGTPAGKIGQLLGSSAMKLVNFRRKREEVSFLLRGIMLPLQPALAAIVSAISTLALLFSKLSERLAPVPGDIPMEIPIGLTGPQIPLELYTYVIVIILSVLGALALSFVGEEGELDFPLYFGAFMAMGGAVCFAFPKAIVLLLGGLQGLPVGPSGP